ncbi:MAG: beta-ketoacyl-ACP synthase II [Phycisphaerae bacterium]
MSRRVVITGLGLITSLGETVPGVWESLCAGKSGIKLITRWDTSDLPVRIGGECTDFNPVDYHIDVREAKRLDRFSLFGMAAARNAVTDSGIDFSHGDPFRHGVLIGSGIGGIETLQEQHRTLVEKGPGRVSPFTVPRLMGNAASGNVSIIFGLRGYNTACATACATGANAIGDAVRVIQRDEADVMIAGGSEAALCKLGVASFCAARALSTRNDEPERASRPWDKDRDGFVMSEGAGVVVLEEYEHATKRGAKIYAEVTGYGLTADAHHITAPHENGVGAIKAMELALADAKVNPSEIDYINAHGTSTSLGDVAEVRAIKHVFGPAAYDVVVNSTKSQIGHLLGASGGVEAIFAAMALQTDTIPPTINLENRDEGCDLDFNPGEARKASVKVAMSNSFGFGGHNACLVLRKI